MAMGAMAERKQVRRGARGWRTSRRHIATAQAQTPVRPTSMLVLGATGTLGRQVVRKALDEGYEVRCIIRPRQTPADFLREWGATTVQCDLSNPEDLPPALVGVHTVVDCATGRPEEPIAKIDWEAKTRLIQSCVAMGIQRFIFFSIDKCDQHPEVPLMRIKHCTERYLEHSGLNYTTLRLCGFMQPLITAYAVPILEEKSVWGTNDQTRIAYMDTQDVAKMAMASLRQDSTIGRTLTLAGPEALTTDEVVHLCEKHSGSEASITRVPSGLLKAARALTSFFQWSKDAADRLAFSEVVQSDQVFDADMTETYDLLGIDPSEISTLDQYLSEYFSRVLKRLKETQGDDKSSTSFYL